MVKSRAAIRVKPRERSWFLPIGLSSNESLALIIGACRSGITVAVAETHIARRNRCDQIHALRFLPAGGQALAHEPDIHFLNGGGGLSAGDGVVEIGAQVTGNGINDVVAELHIDDIVGHWNRLLAVHLAHETGILYRSASGWDLQKVRDHVEAVNLHASGRAKSAGEIVSTAALIHV